MVSHTFVDPGADVDMVLCCVPDSAVEQVVGEWPPRDDVVVLHCSGSLGLDVLGEHPRRASLHPLVSLPDAETGASRLRGAWFGVAGDPAVLAVVEALDGTAVEVPDDARAAYHAAAVIASNHLVGLMGQVERIAAGVGVPLEAFLALAGGTLANVGALGPARALTGPVARGDWSTVRRHLESIDPSEVQAYLAMADQVARLADVSLPVGVVEYRS